MNLRAANSRGFAPSAPPPVPIEIEILLPDGSCIPSTLANARKVLKQARSALLKARKARRQEIAAELQQNLEDRAAARRLLDELAGYERDRRRMAATLRAKVKPEATARQASGIAKRRTALRSSIVGTPTPRSSWVVDDRGMRGVSYHQSYLSRKSSAFYRGAAADRWLYDVRDEAIMRDADGNVIWLSNLGNDVDEIAAAWQAIEDATTRKNGKVQIRIIVPLDADASPEEKAAALRNFCEHVLRPLDLPYSAVLHHPPEGGDQRNAHGHILTNLRPIERVAPYTWAFADEIRGELDGKNGVQMLRHLWAWSMTEAADASKRRMTYTGLSYAARGLPLEAGEHLGEARAAMVARGETVWAHKRNRLKAARNAQRLLLRDIDRKMAALSMVRDTLTAERELAVAAAPRKIIVAAVPPAERPQPLVNAVAGRRTSHDVPRRVVPAGAGRRTTPDVTRRLAPARSGPQTTERRVVAAAAAKFTGSQLSSTAAGLPASPAMLVATNRPGQRHRPAAQVSVAASRRSAPPPIVVETMHEILRRLATARRRKAADPAIAAARHRRDLAEAHERRRDELIVPTRLWLELNPLTPSTSATRDHARRRGRELMTRIAAGGGYVSPRADGVLVQHIRTSDSPTPGEEWWAQDHVQQSMADLQRRQQELLAGAIRFSGLTPSRLTRDKPVPWATTVALADRERLGRWAESPAFHDELAAQVRFLADASTEPSVVDRPTPLRSSATPDGFGGWRDSPAPPYTGAPLPVRLQPFDVAGKPTDHLLRLLHLAGRHPHSIVIATDGRLTVEGMAPALLAPLLHGWRTDPSVERLVIETVGLSRAAGKPTFPTELADALRLFGVKENGGRARPPVRPTQERNEM